MFRHAMFSVASILAFCPAHSNPVEPAVAEVDLELVLAADTSGSVPPGMAGAQALGFAKAFRDPGLQTALTSGYRGRVAVVYFEWAGATDQRIVLPWTVLSTAADVDAFADRLAQANRREVGGETSISGAMLFADYLIRTNAYDGFRKVVDIASNGTNSDGPEIDVGLEALRATGATVNALVLPGPGSDEMGPYATLFAGHDGPLDTYFRTEVIGGPGAFVMAVDPDVGFEDAILRKLSMEVAWSIRETSR